MLNRPLISCNREVRHVIRTSGSDLRDGMKAGSYNEIDSDWSELVPRVGPSLDWGVVPPYCHFAFLGEPACDAAIFKAMQALKLLPLDVTGVLAFGATYPGEPIAGYELAGLGSVFSNGAYPSIVGTSKEPTTCMHIEHDVQCMCRRRSMRRLLTCMRAELWPTSTVFLVTPMGLADKSS